MATVLTRHEGWHRALDMQMDTMKWCLSDFGMELNASFFTQLVKKASLDITRTHLYLGSQATAREFQSLLYTADTCYVTTDMLHVILQAAHDLPNDLVWESHMLLTKAGFCLLEEPLHGEDASGATMGVSAIAWALRPFKTRDGNLGEACHLFFLTDTSDPEDSINPEVVEMLRGANIPVPPLHLCHWYPLIMGRPLPFSFSPERGARITLETINLFTAFNLLAQQKIGTPQRMIPLRATRRRIQREFPDRPASEITLITLRRKSVKHDDEPKEIPWTRRWMVRGHWRKQWYPSTKTHAWKYIYEYIKGPEDKPLVLTERRVFNFRR